MDTISSGTGTSFSSLTRFFGGPSEPSSGFGGRPRARLGVFGSTGAVGSPLFRGRPRPRLATGWVSIVGKGGGEVGFAIADGEDVAFGGADLGRRGNRSRPHTVLDQIMDCHRVYSCRF